MQFHENKQTHRDRLNSLLKCSILRNKMFLIDKNSHYYMYTAQNMIRVKDIILHVSFKMEKYIVKVLL